MAFGGSCLCCSPHRNVSPIDHVENEFTRDWVPPKRSNFDSNSPSPTLSYNFTPAHASIPAPAYAPTSFDELFKQFIKTYLEFNQRPS